MIMAGVNIFVTFVLLAWLTNLGQLASQNTDNYIQNACRVTRYRNLCIHSLASFSNTAKRSPTKWARAGVSVTIGEANSAAQFMMKLKKYRCMRGRNQVALSDCIELFQDAIDELHKSLDTLRKLEGRTFNSQMGDLNTWVSAALTNEDTCLDGFEGQRGKQVKLLQNRVLNSTYLTSNALALVNKLATAGMASLTVP